MAMARASHDRIQRVAMRLARLASLDAPAVMLLDAADRLDELVGEQCRAVELDRDAYRQRRAADRAAEDAASTELTSEEEAEMDAEEAAYDAAEAKAFAKSGYPESTWKLLDSNFRFGLIMDEYEEPKAAHAVDTKAGAK